MVPDLLLLYPPASQARSPHLALPLLKGFLEARGIGCDIADLNLRCLYHFLRPGRIRTSLARIRARLEGEAAGDEAFRSRAELALLYGELVEGRIRESVRTLARGPSDAGDPEAVPRAEAVVRRALEILSAEFHPSRWEEEAFVTRFDPSRMEEVVAAAGTAGENPFSEFFALDGEWERLHLAERSMVGISICYQSQLIPGLTLARAVRQRMGPDFPIVVGGPIGMYMRRNPPALGPLFDLVSHVVYGEGEATLVELYRTLTEGGRMEDVPGLLYRRDGKVRMNPHRASPRLNELPRARFGQYPLRRYLSPTLELPVFSERGCYYGKCTFCCVDLSPERRFDSRRPEKMIRDVAYYRRVHGARHFLFITTALPALKGRRIADEILGRGLDVRWGSNIRYEDRFTSEILARMRRSGCVVLHVGLESGSDRIIDKMEKGFTVEQARAFHGRAREAGIRIGLYIMVGFPGETDADRLATARFLVEAGMEMDDLSIGQFILHEFAPMFQNPGDYGLRVLDNAGQLPFQRSFVLENGREPDRLVEAFRTLLRKLFSDRDHRDRPPSVGEPPPPPDATLSRSPDTAVLRGIGEAERYLVYNLATDSTFEVEDPLYGRAVISADGRTTVAELARRSDTDPASVATVVRELAREGLVRWSPAPAGAAD